MVVGKEMFTAVPKSNLRKVLNKQGRVKKVEFRRSFSPLQVRNRIVQAFPQLKFSDPVFMKCVDLKMVPVDVEGGGFPNGSAVQGIASKESLYLVESSGEVVRTMFVLLYTLVDSTFCLICSLKVMKDLRATSVLNLKGVLVTFEHKS